MIFFLVLCRFVIGSALFAQCFVELSLVDCSRFRYAAPYLLVAIAIEPTQSIGYVTGSITPFAERLPSYILTRGFRRDVTFPGDDIGGGTVGSFCRCTSLENSPHHSCKRLYSSIRPTLLSSAVIWRIMYLLMVMQPFC